MRSRSWGQTRYSAADMVNNQQVISFLTGTFLPQNHMLILCLQTWSYPAEVCNKISDWWLAIHICATHLASAVPTLFITRRNSLTGYCLCTQVGPFGPCDKGRIILIACLFTPVFSVSSCHYILLFWRYFICITEKGVRKVPSHSWNVIRLFQHTLGCHQHIFRVRVSEQYPVPMYNIYDIPTGAGEKPGPILNLWDRTIICFKCAYVQQWQPQYSARDM